MIDKKTALAWLDKQRAIVNDLIVNLTQDEQKTLMPELQVINWLAEAARIHGGEMTAVEYLKARGELCRSYNGHSCDECPLSRVDGGCTEDENDPSRAVEIVKMWKEEQDGTKTV